MGAAVATYVLENKKQYISMSIAAVYVHIVKIKSLSIMFYHYLNIAAVKGSNFFLDIRIHYENR